MRYIVGLLLSVVLVTPALANSLSTFIDSRTPGCEPQLTGSITPTSELNMQTKSNLGSREVLVEGRVIPSESPAQGYYLQDSTGSLAVDIDPNVVGGAVLTPENVVRIKGNLRYVGAGDPLLNATAVELLR